MSINKESSPRIIVALDFQDSGEALEMVDELEGVVDFFKIGSRLFTAEGPPVVERVRRGGKKIFLDLKFHDIPATVAGSVSAALQVGVDMITVHTSGGSAMMESAAGAAGEVSDARPLLVGVTVLTSMEKEDLSLLGGPEVETGELVKNLATAAKRSGLDGVVASVRETEMLRRELGESFVLVTPGIRPRGTGRDDQKRVATPAEAAGAGSDFLVIGRAITGADSPRSAALDIKKELEES